jgi:CheY-like chemotaxis protein
VPDEGRQVLRVVLVDDNDRVREVVARMVTGAGHEVVGHAHDGWAGVELALAERPDVVITDWQMPRMDGVETTRRIRAAHPDVAIVAITAEPNVCDDFLRAGADACVDKRDMRGLLAALVAVESRAQHA